MTTYKCTFSGTGDGVALNNFLDGSEHDNGDDGCNDRNVENVYLMRFLHDNESNRVNF